MGGVVTTTGSILIANGTRDAKARIFNVKNGQLLWEYQLNAPGASPPMTYTFQGCQYIAFNASGGRFWNSEHYGKFIEVFKLSDCEVSDAIDNTFDEINYGSFDRTTKSRKAESPEESGFFRYINYIKNHSLAEIWEKLGW